MDPLTIGVLIKGLAFVAQGTSRHLEKVNQENLRQLNLKQRDIVKLRCGLCHSISHFKQCEQCSFQIKQLRMSGQIRPWDMEIYIDFPQSEKDCEKENQRLIQERLNLMNIVADCRMCEETWRSIWSNLDTYLGQIPSLEEQDFVEPEEGEWEQGRRRQLHQREHEAKSAKARKQKSQKKIQELQRKRQLLEERKRAIEREREEESAKRREKKSQKETVRRNKKIDKERRRRLKDLREKDHSIKQEKMDRRQGKKLSNEWEWKRFKTRLSDKHRLTLIDRLHYVKAYFRYSLRRSLFVLQPFYEELDSPISIRFLAYVAVAWVVLVAFFLGLLFL